MQRLCIFSIFAQLIQTSINMATVKAFIRTTTKNEVNVRFRLSDGRKRQLFHKSEITVDPTNFDHKTQIIKAKVICGNEKRENFTKAITDRKALILKLYNIEANKDLLTSQWLDDSIDKELHPVAPEPETEKEQEPETLFKYLENFVKNAPLRKDKKTGRILSYNNIQQYKATEKHIKAFAASIKKDDFTFSEIDRAFYDLFVTYLQGLDFTQNSVGKHIRILKLMLNESKNREMDTDSFYVFTEDVDTVYLNEAELQKLKDFDLSKTPHLDRVRDWFLLLAWTGCRYSDLEKISKSDIKDDFITFRQQKTNTKVTIPLHPVVLEILKKYKYQMPEQITNQRFNEYIKDAAELAKIDSNEHITITRGGILKTDTMPKHKLISSHTGRRSFCTNMYKRELPTLMIMSVSGHKTEKSFLKYIKVSQEEHAAMMAKKWKEMYK